MLKFLLISTLLLYVSCVHCDNLRSLVIVFRHGARTPIHPYPNDPYKNNSYWPVGFGQLTDEGVKSHYELGRWLRQRYANFIPSNYSEKDIYVMSTDVDRTLMSAEANLAGLYQPKTDIIPNLRWRPIPVHTKPEHDDEILAMKKPCQLYNKLYRQLDKTPFFKNLTRVYHDLYSYLTKYSGEVVNNPDKVEYLYSTMCIEQSYNYTLPQWALKVFPKKLEYLARLSFTLKTFTPELARLKTGPFFHHLTQHFKNITLGNQTLPKIRVYSAHDTTIASILNSMKLFNNLTPPFAATILFELRQDSNDSYYLNLFYKNTTMNAFQLHLNGCELNCELGKFTQILRDVTLSPEVWEQECILSWFDFLPFGHKANVILISVSLSFILILISLLFVRSWIKRGENTWAANTYVFLPNDEEQ